MTNDAATRAAGWSIVLACAFGALCCVAALCDGCAHVPHSPCIVEVP